MKRLVWTVAWAIALAGFSAQVAQAQSSTIVAQHTTWLVKKGSSDFNRIRAFLIANSGPGIGPYRSSDLDLTKLGDLTVQLSVNGVSDSSISYDKYNPPDMPPAGLPVGSTWSISNCINGEAQSWGWTSQSNGKGGTVWVLTSYSDDKNATCGPNKKAAPPNGN